MDKIGSFRSDLNSRTCAYLCAMLHGFFLGVQLCFWLLVARRLVFFSEKKKDTAPPPVSVVICARNEAENLKAHLPTWTAQTGVPSFEVLVVDDASTDETAAVLAHYQESCPNLRVLRLEAEAGRPYAGKKSALVAGIQAARHEFVLLTDADCRAASHDWAARMGNAFGPTTDMVLGYGPYARYPGALNRWIRYETLWTGILYLSLARAGVTYMGVGRNIAYRKAAFLGALDVFDRRPGLLSGDDDLLVNRLAKKGNTALCLHPDAFTISEPKHTWAAWLRQKRRHLSTGKHYRAQHILLLSALSLSHVWSWAGFVLWPFFTWKETLCAGVLFSLRALVVWIVGAALARRFQEKDLAPRYLFFDALFTIYYLMLFPFTLIGKTVRWK